MIVAIMLLLALSGGPEEPSYEPKEVVTGDDSVFVKEDPADSKTIPSGQPGPRPK